MLYVLWILVVISLLAFKFSSASRVVVLKQVSSVSQIKKKMQIDSVIQFASFKLLSDGWQDEDFELNLNGQSINVSIYGESGFLSFYDLSSESLKKIFETTKVSASSIEEMMSQVSKNNLVFNDFMEIAQFDGVSIDDVKKIIPFVSIYHQNKVNPEFSPVEVLYILDGVDKYRVDKMMESTDKEEFRGLRKEVVDILRNGRSNVSNGVANYYRVHALFDDKLYRIFLKFDPRSPEIVVVNIVYPGIV